MMAEAGSNLPPLTPTDGSSLAQAIATTIPIINHSLRIRASKPIARGSPQVPASGYASLVPGTQSFLSSQLEPQLLPHFRTHTRTAITTVKAVVNAHHCALTSKDSPGVDPDDLN